MNATTTASTLTQVLVHLDGTSRSGRRLATARELAHAHGAAVAALYAVTPALLALPFAAEGAAAAAALLEDMDSERRGTARAAFEHVLKTDGPGVSWAEVVGYPLVGAFARQALHADLLVMGQFDAADPESAGVPGDFVEGVLADSGKPALVLPYEGGPATIGRVAVIAWKPTREAARAVSAALPLLQRASRVHVAAWGEGEEDDEDIQGRRLSLDSFLHQHGIDVVWHRERGPEPDAIGDLLLSYCCDLDADLLVMGCYGRSRAREWVLGGVTRTVLRTMTLPVLMSH